MVARRCTQGGRFSIAEIGRTGDRDGYGIADCDGKSSVALAAVFVGYSDVVCGSYGRCSSDGTGGVTRGP